MGLALSFGRVRRQTVRCVGSLSFSSNKTDVACGYARALAAQEVFLVLTPTKPTAPSGGPASPRLPHAGQFDTSYNPALDGLRAVAIVLVLLSHAHAPLFEGAFYGVDLFFVLSGYLITSLLLQELQRTDRIDYWRFYRRRFYRLMPALLLFLVVYCLLAPVLWPGQTDMYTDALVSALYLADYGIAFFDQPDTLLHMWSLSVEEHFYLIWPPLLALLVHRTPRGQLWRVVLGLLVLGWAWRVMWVAQGQLFYEIFFRFDTRATGLLTGALLAALVREQPAWFQALRARLPHFMWLVLAVPLLMEQAWDDMNALVWGMTVVELATALVLVAVLVPRGPLHDMLSARPLVLIGKLSYGIYLWHYPVVRYLRADLPWPAVVLLGFLISTALAAVSYYTVERWALRRRDAPDTRPGPAGGGAPDSGLANGPTPGAGGVAAAPSGIWGVLTGAGVAHAARHAAVDLDAAAAHRPPRSADSLPAALHPGVWPDALSDGAMQPSVAALMPGPLDVSVLTTPLVAVPAKAPLPINARSHWPVALAAGAYSQMYRMSYGHRAYRLASGRASAARSAVVQALRMRRAAPLHGPRLRPAPHRPVAGLAGAGGWQR